MFNFIVILATGRNIQNLKYSVAISPQTLLYKLLPYNKNKIDTIYIQTDNYEKIK